MSHKLWSLLKGDYCMNPLDIQSREATEEIRGGCICL